MKKRILLVTGLTVALSAWAATEFNIAHFSAINDISNGGDQDEDVSIDQAASFRYDIYVRRGNEKVVLPTDAYPVWKVWASTDQATLYINDTGTVHSASAGQVRMELDPDETNFAAGTYESVVNLYNAAGSKMGTVARGQVVVTYNPDSIGASYVGTDSVFSLEDLTDVDLGTLSDAESLQYDSATGVWTNQTGAGSGDITGVSVSGGLLTGGGDSGSVTVTLTTNSVTNAILSTWANLDTDSTDDATGDLTAVEVSGGLLTVSSGTGPIPTVGLTSGAVTGAVGTAWANLDTDSTDDFDGVYSSLTGKPDLSNTGNWDTAYGWGDHSGTYLTLAGGTMGGNIVMGGNDITGGGSIDFQQMLLTHATAPTLMLYDSDTGAGYNLAVTGTSLLLDHSNGEQLWLVDTNGDFTVYGTLSGQDLDINSLTMGGNIVITGTVDGYDVGTMGAKLAGIEAGADVTDTDNVTSAGALMDSEVDADLKTFSLPASTTISAFGKTLVDDADAGTARATLDVDQAGTDNSTDVTLAGTPDYIVITNQVITRHAVDLAADVTGTLPDANVANDITVTNYFTKAESAAAYQPLDADLTTLAGPTAWRLFYSNGGSAITELALGTSGTYLKANGTTSAPTWATPGGSGDFLADGSVPMTGNLNLGSQAVTNGTWEGTIITDAYLADNLTATNYYTKAEADAGFEPTVTEGSLADSVIVSADIKDATIDEGDLDVSVNSSLDLADSAVQAADIDTLGELETVSNGGAYMSDMLAATNEANFKSIVNLEAGTDFLAPNGDGSALTAVDAATGDSATDFFDAGEIADARISDTITVGSGGSVDDAALSNDASTRTITICIGDGTNAISGNPESWVQVPFNCTITSWTALADASGSIQVDVWKDTYANYPPTDADTITGANEIAISTATKATDSTLTSWTTSITAGDILKFYTDSSATVKRVIIILEVEI